MERRRKLRLMAIAWIGLGLLQVFLGYRTGNTPYAVFGGVFALLGVAYFYSETRESTET